MGSSLWRRYAAPDLCVGLCCAVMNFMCSSSQYDLIICNFTIWHRYANAH